MIVYLFAYLHHIVAFILVTIVLLQNILLSEFPDQKTIRQLRFLDTLYGVSAALILIIGFSRIDIEMQNLEEKFYQ